MNFVIDICYIGIDNKENGHEVSVFGDTFREVLEEVALYLENFQLLNPEAKIVSIRNNEFI